jgi:hypothetical protein
MTLSLALSQRKLWEIAEIEELSAVLISGNIADHYSRSVAMTTSRWQRQTAIGQML